MIKNPFGVDRPKVYADAFRRAWENADWDVTEHELAAVAISIANTEMGVYVAWCESQEQQIVQLSQELAATQRAKQENDERFQLALAEAREKIDDLRALVRSACEREDNLSAEVSRLRECQTPEYTDGQCHCAYHDPAREKASPVDWEAIARQREQELKAAGEARHRAEVERDAVRRHADPCDGNCGMTILECAVPIDVEPPARECTCGPVGDWREEGPQYPDEDCFVHGNPKIIESPAESKRQYPYSDGGWTILGPDICASGDGKVIFWEGRHYDVKSWTGKYE